MTRKGMGARERLLRWGQYDRWTIATGMPRGWPQALARLVREGMAETMRVPVGHGRHFYTRVEYRLTPPRPDDRPRL